jgi:hypothetical protein
VHCREVCKAGRLFALGKCPGERAIFQRSLVRSDELHDVESGRTLEFSAYPLFSPQGTLSASSRSFAT